MSDNSFELESEYSTYSFNSSKTENDSFKKQMDNISVEEMKEIFKDNKNEEDKDDLSCKENEVESDENIANSTPAEHKTSLFRTSISDRTNDTTLLKNKNEKKNEMEEDDEELLNHYVPLISSKINNELSKEKRNEIKKSIGIIINKNLRKS